MGGRPFYQQVQVLRPRCYYESPNRCVHSTASKCNIGAPKNKLSPYTDVVQNCLKTAKLVDYIS